MAKVDADEKELLESVEHGEWRSAGGCKRERTRYARHAKATFRKDRRLNIRLSSEDLEAIDARQTGHRSRTRRLRCSSRAAAAAGLLYGVHAIMMAKGRVVTDARAHAVSRSPRGRCRAAAAIQVQASVTRRG